jgi:hypothetical protein
MSLNIVRDTVTNCIKLGLLLLPLLLTGCAGKMAETTVETMFDSSGKVITETTTTIAEASVKKEEAVHKTLQQYLSVIASTGMRMGWQQVEETHFYPGMSAPVTVVKHMPTFSYVDPSSIQKLPTAPSEHPVWRVGGQALETVAKYGMIGYGIHEVSGVLAAGINGAGGNYYSSSNSSSMSTDHSVSDSHNIADSSDNSNTDNSTTDNSDRSTTDNSDRSTTDNSVGPVDNSVGPVDNSTGPVDNSTQSAAAQEVIE